MTPSFKGLSAHPCSSIWLWNQLPADSPAKPLFARVLQLTGQVIEEGRDAVRGFRSNDREALDLERAFSRVPQELDLKERIDFRIIVEGHPQSLHPVIRDEVYSIGREALVNSFRHSGAAGSRLNSEYEASQLRVLVRDDGCGGPTSRYCNPGAKATGGCLVCASERRESVRNSGSSVKTGTGTEVELRVPGSIAFESRSLELGVQMVSGSAPATCGESRASAQTASRIKGRISMKTLRRKGPANPPELPSPHPKVRLSPPSTQPQGHQRDRSKMKFSRRSNG